VTIAIVGRFSLGQQTLGHGTGCLWELIPCDYCVVMTRLFQRRRSDSTQTSIWRPRSAREGATPFIENKQADEHATPVHRCGA